MSLLLGALLLLLPAVAEGGEKIDLQFDEKVVIFGGEPGDKLGEAVTAGDYDGDGIDDLLVGAPWADAPDRANAGRVYLFFGSAQRSSADGVIDLSSADLLFFGMEADHELGRHLASGDLDGDGREELILGTFYADGPKGERENCGEAYLFFGRPREEFPDTIDLGRHSADLTITGADEKDHLTEEMTTGDIDGDGLADLVIGAFYGDGPDNERHHAGEVFLLFGRDRTELPKRIDLASYPLPTIYGPEAGDTFGRAVATGDLDGDGREEVIVGAYYGDGPENTRINSGETYVVFGCDRDSFPMKIDLAEAPEVVIYGAWDGDVSGRAVAAADLDGDGKDDLAISSHLASRDRDLDPSSHTGQAFLFFGRDRPNFPSQIDLRSDADCRITGSSRIDILGWPIVAGTWDDDGREDLLIVAKHSRGGEIGRLQAGQAYLVPGRERMAFLPELPAAEAGRLSVVGAGEGDLLAFDAVLFDWNGDGHGEIGLGVPEAKGQSDGGPRTGEVIIVFATR